MVKTDNRLRTQGSTPVDICQAPVSDPEVRSRPMNKALAVPPVGPSPESLPAGEPVDDVFGAHRGPLTVTDDEMAARVAAHRAARPEGWRTVEGHDVVGALRGVEPGATVLLDSLGTWVSELLPKTAEIVDEIALIKSVNTSAINHDPACTFVMTGSEIPGKASLGSWLAYGLGSESNDLPAFVVLTPNWSSKANAQALFTRMWSSGFLATRYTGVALRAVGDPVLYIQNPAGVDRAVRGGREQRRACGLAHRACSACTAHTQSCRRHAARGAGHRQTRYHVAQTTRRCSARRLRSHRVARRDLA